MAIFNKISHMIEQEYSSEENRGQENKQEKVRSIFDDRPVNPISVRPRIFNNTDDTITMHITSMHLLLLLFMLQRKLLKIKEFKLSLETIYL